MIEINENDELILEALVKSPAFATLKKLLLQYKSACYSEITSASDANRFFQIQGRLIGLGAVENLPEVIVKRRAARIKREEEERKKKDDYEKRLGIKGEKV